MAATFHPLVPLLGDVAMDSWAGLGQGLITLLALLVSSIGIATIVWGAYSSIVRLIASEAGPVLGPRSGPDGPAARPIFFSYLLAGLEFLIAGCLIKTLAVPDWQQASVLASLVLARTLLGLSGKWEGGLGVALWQDKALATRTAAGSPEVLQNHPAALPEVSESEDLLAAAAGR